MLAIERRIIERAATDIPYREHACAGLGITLGQLKYRFKQLGIQTKRNVRRKLTLDDERLMYELRADGMTYSVIGEKFDVTGSAASLAVKRYVYRAIERGETLRSV